MRALLLVLLLTGCGTAQVVVPREVRVQVAVPCLTEAPEKPAIRSRAELLAMPSYPRTLAAWASLLAYEAYTAELEAVVEGCSRIPNASAAGSPGGVGGDSSVKPAVDAL